MVTMIKVKRLQLGYKQKELAILIGDRSTNLCQIECGTRRAWPKIRKNISQVLEMSESDLFDRDGNPLPVNWDLLRGEAM